MKRGPVRIYQEHKDGLQLAGWVFLAGVAASNLWVTRDNFNQLATRVDRIAQVQEQQTIAAAIKFGDHDRQLAVLWDDRNRQEDGAGH